ncbi:MAG: hypothetical protein A3F77_04510 [Betaproteobacteria bacterium RIFCSPLOWO2_12_FULL_67_28]|nr:MAG: hypothetical protein A3I65_07985 [Betaproteobacteria bacterium RIFCSPLOWO2_02_FULL_68_150]OGA56222.1 MAG: hypothetical protein A3F77_04510 [Betaproteobacteria bacterium RIFCSPLOWO2_12_FULL_67_28]
MKKYLITGLLIWIPLVITIWVLKLVVDTLDQTLLLLPPALRTESWLGVHIPGLGVLLTVVIVLVTGVLAANFIGERLVRIWNELLHRIPFVSSIYSSVKQVSDTLFSSGGQAFRKALLVQWPREGMWTIGFLTGLPGGEVANHLPGDFLSVYVPTTPNPTGGYFVILARKDVIELDMSVDQALTYIISMGVVAPGTSARNGKS